MSLVVLVCLIALIDSHAVGQGAVIFPNDHRAAGTALGSSTHWIFAAMLTFLFPIAMAHVEAQILFVVFCSCMCLRLLWVKFTVPETKGITLEEIERKLGILKTGGYDYDNLCTDTAGHDNRDGCRRG